LKEKKERKLVIYKKNKKEKVIGESFVKRKKEKINKKK